MHSMQLSSSTVLGLFAGASLCFLLALATRRLPGTHRKTGQQQHSSTSSAGTAHGPESDTVITEDFCLDWLHANMPKRDRHELTDKQLRRHIRLALAARGASPWAAAVPVDLWLNDVLPYRSVDEPLDAQDWRPMFYEKFMPLVADANSLTEAAQILNRDIWAIWGLHFVPDQTPEIMSVGQVLAKGYASCTGLSIFLVNACRAVGIPARIAGTPSWVADRRDSPEERFNNHNWVEIWDGTWSFTGALEYNPAGLNRTWFFPQPAKGQLPGDHWHAIYAASFKRTGTVFPLAWALEDESVPGVDVTQAYIDAAVPPTAPAAAAAAAAHATADASATAQRASDAAASSVDAGSRQQDPAAAAGVAAATGPVGIRKAGTAVQ